VLALFYPSGARPPLVLDRSVLLIDLFPSKRGRGGGEEGRENRLGDLYPARADLRGEMRLPFVNIVLMFVGTRTGKEKRRAKGGWKTRSSDRSPR